MWLVQASYSPWDTWIPARLCGTSSGRSDHPVTRWWESSLPLHIFTHPASDPDTSRPLSWLLQTSRLDIWDTLMLPFPQLVGTSLSPTSRMLSLLATARLEKFRYNIRISIEYRPASVQWVCQYWGSLTYLDLLIPLIGPLLGPVLSMCIIYYYYYLAFLFIHVVHWYMVNINKQNKRSN